MTWSSPPSSTGTLEARHNSALRHRCTSIAKPNNHAVHHSPHYSTHRVPATGNVRGAPPNQSDHNHVAPVQSGGLSSQPPLISWGPFRNNPPQLHLTVYNNTENSGGHKRWYTSHQNCMFCIGTGYTSLQSSIHSSQQGPQTGLNYAQLNAKVYVTTQNRTEMGHSEWNPQMKCSCNTMARSASVTGFPGAKQPAIVHFLKLLVRHQLFKGCTNTAL